MSERYAYTKPKIIQSHQSHSRGSSNDSRTSYSSKSSTEGHYSSARSSMGNGGYSDGSYREDTRDRRYRTADDDNKYVQATTSRSGKVEVIHQNRVIYDPDAPRSSDANAQQYKESREHRKHKSSSHSHSSHKHKH